MEALKMVLTILFVIVCIVLTVIILMQEGKSAGLGTISGAADSYWGKNKGRSIEGKLEKFTKILAVVFMVLAIVLNINFDRSSADASDDTTVTATESVSTEAADSEETEETAAEETEETTAEETESSESTDEDTTAETETTVETEDTATE